MTLNLASFFSKLARLFFKTFWRNFATSSETTYNSNRCLHNMRRQLKFITVMRCSAITLYEVRNVLYKHYVAGVMSKVGWAFGLGLERLAMKLYSIPDVRLFWSDDSGFLSQFNVTDCHTPITYKVCNISIYNNTLCCNCC